MKKLYILQLLIVLTLTITSPFSAQAKKQKEIFADGDVVNISFNVLKRFYTLSGFDRQRYILNKYISARETYNLDTIEQNYHTFVRDYSSDEAYKSFISYLNDHEDVPDHPKNLKNKKRVITIHHTSIQNTGPSASYATIKFTSEDVDSSTGETTNKKHKVAKIRYLLNGAIKLKDNETGETYKNPFKFQVLDYKISNGKE